MGKVPTNIDYSLRKNISKACTFCKSRKRKCDGQTPCGFCQKKNKNGICSYDIIDKRSLRYSYLKYESHEEHQHNVDNGIEYGYGDDAPCQESKLLSSEIKLPSLSPNVEIFHIANNNNSNNISDITSGSKNGQSASVVKPKNTFSEHVASVLGITSHEIIRPIKSSPAFVSINDYEDGYQDNSDGNYNHIGQSSTLSLLHFSRNLFKSLNFNEFYSEILTDNQLPGIDKVSLDLSKSNFVPSINDKYIIKDAEINTNNLTSTITPLPPREVCDIYVDLFLQNANQLIYIINDNFLKNSIVEEAYNNFGEMSSKKLCQLYMILSIGSIYLKSCQTSTTNPYTHVPTDYSNLSLTYFHSALIIYNSLIKDGNLWIVEMKTLIFLYYQLVNKKNVAWLNLTSAIKVAESLGLHRKIANDSIKNKQQAIHRRKIWRGLYILDRVISISLGKPLTINNDIWDDKSSLPIEDSIGNLRSVCENQLTKISILTGDIYETIYFQNSNFKIKKIIELIKNLNLWANYLPIQLKAEQILKMDDQKEFLRTNKTNERFDLLPLLLLHLFHLNAVILLSRPFFQYKLSKDIESFILVMNKKQLTLLNIEKRDSEISIIKNLSDSCTNSSIFIIKFCWYFVKNKLHPIKPYMLINTVFNASLIISLTLLVDVLELIKLKKLNKDFEEWEQLVSNFKEHYKILNVSFFILKEYSNLDKIAERMSIILSDLNESILKLFETSMNILKLNEFFEESFKKWINEVNKASDIDLNEIIYNHDINIKSFGHYEISNLIGNEQIENKFNEELNLVKGYLSNLTNTEGEFSF